MILELENVTKLYKNGRGAEDVSFALDSGEVLGLLGPNGSGKTTIMKAIAGLVRIQSGSIRICGSDAVSLHEKAMANVGCLIESHALYAHMTARQNLQMAARFYDNANVDDALRLVGMEKYGNDKVNTFSLGMKQRIGLALALISKPRLLILDEPANGLDIEGMVYVREVITQAAENGAAVLITSHLAAEIQQCATKAAVISEGRLLGECKSMDKILTEFETLEDYFIAMKRGAL